MFNIKELKNSPEYWLENVQNEIYNELKTYMVENKLNQTQLSEKLGFSKSYISQVLSGEFNYSIKKFIELSLAIGKTPILQFENTEVCEETDNCKVINFSEYLKEDLGDTRGVKPKFQFNKEILINES